MGRVMLYLSLTELHWIYRVNNSVSMGRGMALVIPACPVISYTKVDRQTSPPIAHSKEVNAMCVTLSYWPASSSCESRRTSREYGWGRRASTDSGIIWTIFLRCIFAKLLIETFWKCAGASVDLRGLISLCWILFYALHRFSCALRMCEQCAIAQARTLEGTLDPDHNPDPVD